MSSTPSAFMNTSRDDEERPCVPHWIPYGESHQESLLHPRSEKYPFLLVSNHPRWRVHANHDDISWLREIATCKVKGPDGYLYEPVWIHPSDAKRLGIEHGEIVKLFNDRGAVMGGAYVTERIMPGVLYQDHGARVDTIVPGELDRGGANNLICPGKTTSKNCVGEVTNGFLVGIAKVDLDELRMLYPEAFEKAYDPSSGLLVARLDRRRRTTMKSFVIDVARCNGCYNCQIACKEEHVGNDWTPYAKAQPDTGQFWMKINEKMRGSVPKVKVSYVAAPCMHCRNAPCVASCAVGAIYRRDDGIVLIDPIACTGCINCVDACPYGAIYFNREMNLAQKCTGCAHLLDRGWKAPRCVDACPTDAIRFGDEKELQTFIDAAEVLLPEEETHPLVYYLNLPKRFISGSIFAPEADECLEEVTLTLTGDTKDRPKTVTRTLKTDSFGDFWFNQIDAAIYALKVEKEGYATRTIEAIDVYRGDVNLGDISLERTR